MSADRLRDAAAVLRERGNAAPPGPWSVGLGIVGSELQTTGMGSVSYRQKITEPDPFDYEDSDDPEASAEEAAAYIATMHPGIALIIADWLDSTANDVEHVHPPIYNLTSTTVSRAVAVADAILER